MKRHDFFTGYGARHWTMMGTFAEKADVHSDVPLEVAAQLVDRIAYDLQGNRGTLPDDYKLTVGDKTLDQSELVRLVHSKQHLLSLQAILNFERSFAKTLDPREILSQYESGGRDARMLVRRLSLFPTEGVNVWAEFAFPEYAHYQRQGQLESRVEAFFRTNLGDIELLHVHGPNIPGLDQAVVMDLLSDKLPKMRYEIRNAIGVSQDADPRQFLN